MGSKYECDCDPRRETEARSMTALSAGDADGLIAATPPAAVELARVVSLAARIEPELLRRARFELLPNLDVSAEADLWFSNLADLRSTRWMVLHVMVAARLRQELARDRQMLDRAWTVVQSVHARSAPAIVLEEEVTYLALSPGGTSAAAIERKLASVVQAIVTEERVGLIDWAIRAIPRLPDRARDTQGAVTLGLVASGSMPTQIRIQRLPIDPTLTELVARGLPQVDLWLRLVADRKGMRLEISRHRMKGATSIKVPATEPVIVDVSANSEQQLLTIGGTDAQSFIFSGPETAVSLRSAAGGVYKITRDWGEKKNTSVLVVGPAKNLSPWLRNFSIELGLSLARQGYSLITAGGTGVEQLVAEAFVEAAGESAEVRIQHMVGPNRKPGATVGTVVRARSDHQWMRRATSGAKVVIVLEGGPRTRMLGQYAMDQRLPLIPVGERGAASQLRQHAVANWLSLEMRTFHSLKRSSGDVSTQISAINQLLGLRDKLRWNLIDDEPPAH
jgi:hypothetical protein